MRTETLKERNTNFVYFESHNLILCAITRGEMFLFFISKKECISRTRLSWISHSPGLTLETWVVFFFPLFLTFLFWNNYKETLFFFTPFVHIQSVISYCISFSLCSSFLGQLQMCWNWFSHLCFSFSSYASARLIHQMNSDYYSFIQKPSFCLHSSLLHSWSHINNTWMHSY